MKRVLIWAPLGLFVVALVLVASQMIRPSERTIKSAMVGQPVPALALAPLVEGKPGVQGGFASGQPRLINVFASWCAPCIAEAPHLMALKNAGVQIDGIATADTREDMQAFLARNGDPFARIGDDGKRAFQFALGSAGVPESFVVDGRGTIVMQHIGDIRADDVPKILAALEQAR